MAAETILLVEDNPANRQLTTVVLSVAGYDVRTAIDAEDALRVLQSVRPGIILMDIQLPGMDGLELTRRLKADPATRDILIVAVSAYAMKGDDQKAIQAGCDGYITKPINTRTLAQTVAGYLAREPGKG
jgi:two-component system cell cycle response regulator